MRQKSRAEAAEEAIGSQAKHATENVGILDALAMVRFVESPYVGSTILGGYQRNLNRQGNAQIPVQVGAKMAQDGPEPVSIEDLYENFEAKK